MSEEKECAAEKPESKSEGSGHLDVEVPVIEPEPMVLAAGDIQGAQEMQATIGLGRVGPAHSASMIYLVNRPVNRPSKPSS